jgi:DNA-binding transcriptional MerR regulator
LDKAPDAFRTISEVAEDLDIPQHVLRFWETRFIQIKPMKRSGGRRYYRPDDVDLLRGIRRLLYGEGYTIRGVQRILKEHGIKSVQSLADDAPAPVFAQINEATLSSVLAEDDFDDVGANDVDEDDEDDFEPAPARRAAERGSPAPEGAQHGEVRAAPRVEGPAATPGKPAAAPLDLAKLETVLQDLIACRQMLDHALNDG